QRLFYHQNAIYSVFALTNIAANKVECYQYDAYGRPSRVSAVGNPYMFTGRRLDPETSPTLEPETGLYYYRARYYDTNQGRFIQRDPLWDVVGENLYVYVQSNPTNATDSLGLWTSGPHSKMTRDKLKAEGFRDRNRECVVTANLNTDT